MKNFLPLIFLLGSTAMFTQTKTTVADGNFFALTTWDCFCLPVNGDTLVINHKVTMNTGIAYTSGKITISGPGELTDGGVDKDILINGGEFHNYGSLDCDGFLLESGYVYNSGSFNLDSLWVRDTMDNHGAIDTYDFLNDQNGKFISIEDIAVGNNFANQGVFSLSGANMTVVNNFSNCNISSSDATFTITNGVLCVENDFLNCGTDTLRGTNGEIFIAGASTNGGEVEGSLEINTSSGSFSINTGTVEGTVTFGTGNCYLGSDIEEPAISINVYPNPSNGIIYLSESNHEYSLIDISGKTLEYGFISGNSLDFSSYSTGVYFLELRKGNTSTVEKLILE